MAEISEQTKGNISIEDPLTRIAVAALISVFTTFAILWVMQILIATGKGAISSKYEGRFVDFVRIKKDEDLDTKNAKPKKPPEPGPKHIEEKLKCEYDGEKNLHDEKVALYNRAFLGLQLRVEY